MSTFSANDNQIPLFTRFIESQIHKIDIDKWQEGFKLNKDPGEDYVHKWISKNSIWFRDTWYKSSCKNCEKWDDCGWKVRCECPNFKQLNEEDDSLGV